ncbi:MAG: Cytosol aminopeptidase PepA [Nitrospira sp.]|jgi:leucyl aminopeptidase|nr:MAG: Cytosol aminopeptidase PepA [Nitrospira sp.]
MKMMQVQGLVGQAEREAVEVLVLLRCEGESGLTREAVAIDAQLGGQLAELIKRGEFEGKLGEALLLHTQGKAGAKRLLLTGLGKEKDLRLDAFRQALGSAVKRVRQAKVRSFAVVMPETLPHESSVLDVAQALVEGAVLGNYQFTAYRSDNGSKPVDVERLTLYTSQRAQLARMTEGIRRGVATAEATVLVRDLCNHPSNVMTPTRIVHEARAVAKESGVRVKVLEQTDMERLGMGALLGVARGSHEPPKFIILEYQSAKAKKAERPVVLVGKTITFDTGGISLKPAENMEHMKADMTGGAEVLATMRAAARLKLPLHLISILPVAENMPGGRAMKPGDIVTTLSGKTVEVQNTDAEGRLILADGLAYAIRYKPAVLIDIATLTGACVVALGQFAIGMFGNSDQLKGQVRKAGLQAGERVWEMPLWEDYFEQLRSDVADMRNIGGRGGGMITAALFLSKFVGDCPWVHLDIASTDWSERERAYLPKGPTGIGTRLLIQFLIDRTLK